ncbi:MAG: HAD family hydrolase [Dysgonamonadaceae bacterium]|jgi:putative hydrolase of the HAD superfamily|nr:HAD family hydrolase [Dysgonamonadaceae bacterium]
MLNLNQVKGIIFDYGATIDTNGKHWSEVLWEAYLSAGVPVSKAEFRDAYVYAERYLALHPVIRKEDTFKNVLRAKTAIQLQQLVENGCLMNDELKISEYFIAISNHCFNFARSTVSNSGIVLKQLSEKYPMALVSNFYGNIRVVLKDFGIRGFFTEVIESALVGVRKPDPAIFMLGAEALNLAPQEVVVVGDSYTKDIAPAQSIGCQTIWLKGLAWDDEQPDLQADAVISDFATLKTIFQLNEK